MKKRFCILLAVCIAVSLAACQVSASEAPAAAGRDRGGESTPAPSAMVTQDLRKELPSGVAVNAEATYPSGVDFGDLPIYAGTVQRLDEEAAKQALLGDAAILREDTQPSAESVFPDALYHLYETDSHAYLMVHGETLSYFTGDSPDVTRYFYPDKGGDPYNGGLFLTGEDLPFATRQQGRDALLDVLDALGVKVCGNYECYTLEHSQLQAEADRLYAAFQMESAGEEKPAYTAADDSYFYRFYGCVDASPVTSHVSGSVDEGTNVAGTTVEAVYSAGGIRSLTISTPYVPGEVESRGPGLTLDAALGKVDKKYGPDAAQGAYEVQEAAFEYVPVAAGSRAEVRLVPAWRFGLVHTMEFDAKDGSGSKVKVPFYEQFLLDATTGEELPMNPGHI